MDLGAYLSANLKVRFYSGWDSCNDYLPWAWDQLNPTWADWGILAGSFGWFGMWFLLFAKNFPIVAIQEIKEMIPMPRKRGGHH